MVAPGGGDLKYVAFIMRADNKGEGGIMALMTLALRSGDPASRRQKILIALGLFGAALFYGDGAITPPFPFFPPWKVWR